MNVHIYMHVLLQEQPASAAKTYSAAGQDVWAWDLTSVSQSMLSVFNNFGCGARGSLPTVSFSATVHSSMRVLVAMLAYALAIGVVPQLWLFCYNKSVDMQ